MKNRKIGLDLVRSYAILQVLLSHSLYTFCAGTNVKFMNYLPDGVSVFFVLSGYLIGTIFLSDVIQKKIDMKNLLTFWLRRWLRTLPLYYLILGLNYILAFYHVIDADANVFTWKFLFFLQNFNWYFYGFFMESWSLSVEEWFYLLMPVFTFGLSRFLSANHSFLLAASFMLLTSIIFRFERSENIITTFQWDFQIRKVVIMRFDTIIIGVLLAFLQMKYSHSLMRGAYWMAIVGIIILILIRIPNIFLTTRQYTVWFFLWDAIGIALLMILFINLKISNRFLKRCIIYISKTSYAAYLTHGIIISLFVKFLFTTHNSTYLFLIFWPITFFCSWIVHKYYEYPILKMRDKFFSITSTKAF
jgi:peptidoglycan/LPS O-acetylase OafA/YrhL